MSNSKADCIIDFLVPKTHAYAQQSLKEEVTGTKEVEIGQRIVSGMVTTYEHNDDICPAQIASIHGANAVMAAGKTVGILQIGSRLVD